MKTSEWAYSCNRFPVVSNWFFNRFQRFLKGSERLINDFQRFSNGLKGFPWVSVVSNNPVISGLQRPKLQTRGQFISVAIVFNLWNNKYTCKLNV